MGVQLVSTDELVTNEAKEEWKTFMQYHKTVEVLFRDRYFRIAIFNQTFSTTPKNVLVILERSNFNSVFYI